MTVSDHRIRGQSPPRKPASKPSSDPYYGNETIAKLAAAFITHLFSCPDQPPPATAAQPSSSTYSAPSPRLAQFVAYALHRTRLHDCVTFAALLLLQRLKQRFPAAKGSSGHRLFISAFMIASKVICDDTYSNKSWAVVGQSMFALKEINQMEREMCGYLEWGLNVHADALQVFTHEIIQKHAGGASAVYSSSAPKYVPKPSVDNVVPAGKYPLGPDVPVGGEGYDEYVSMGIINPAIAGVPPSPATLASTGNALAAPQYVPPASTIVVDEVMEDEEDDEEAPESPSHSTDSSPSSSAVQTPPSHEEQESRRLRPVVAAAHGAGKESESISIGVAPAVLRAGPGKAVSESARSMAAETAVW